MDAPAILFGISLVFGLHILLNLLRNKETPITSVIFHIFTFLSGFMLVNIPGDLYKGGDLTVAALVSWLALFVGSVFLFKDVLSKKRPSALLGFTYIVLVGAGAIFIIS
jgi:hypothetical protein